MSLLNKLFVQAKRHFAAITDTKPILPRRGTRQSAGYDLYLPKRVVLRPKRYTDAIPLNVKCYIPSNEFLMLVPRSSMAKRHIMLCNTVGIIDADYVDNKSNEGNISVALYNYGDETVVLEKGERVCQGIFLRYQVADDDAATGTRAGGYGSTGR